MPNEILNKEGTPVVFADATDYSSTASGLTRTAQLLLENIANNLARQSDKVDLGATRPRQYAVRAGFEFTTAPTAGGVVEVYWSASFSATAGTGNDGGASGVDGTYRAAGVDEDEFKKQLIFLGALVVTNDAQPTPQYQTIGYFTPPHRYGQVVVVNKAGQALNTADAIEMFVALIPITDEIQ